MSEYHHTLKFDRDGNIVAYRPPAAPTEGDIMAAGRVAAALPGLVNPGATTGRLSVVEPEPSVWPHDKWFGTSPNEPLQKE